MISLRWVFYKLDVSPSFVFYVCHFPFVELLVICFSNSKISSSTLQLLVSDVNGIWGTALLNPPALAVGGASAPPPGYPTGLHAIDAVRVEKETWLGRLLSLGPQMADFVSQSSGMLNE